MEGGTTNEINKLYFELLVSKNKLPILQTYYSNIKNQILTDLTDLYNEVVSMHAWVDSQIIYLNNTRTEQATSTNDFIASSSDNLIVSHPKYQEMMDRYSEYVSKFYSRIHSLENEGISNSYTVNNFINNEIGQVSSYWKFHYTDQYGNALPVEHKFCALNITSESDILELSNNRYVYLTNENVLYDVDYTTKDVYIYYLDNKTIDNITEDSSFHSLFTVKDKNKIFIFIVTKKMTSSDLETITESEIVGNGDNIYKIDIYEYDDINLAINKKTGSTSFYIDGDIISNNKLKVVDSSAIKGYYYAYINQSIIRFKIVEENDELDGTEVAKVHNFNNKICEVVELDGRLIFPQVNESNNNTRLVAYETTSNGSIDLLNLIATITLNSFPENDSRFNTDNQIVNLFKSDNIGGTNKVGIYIVTNTNIWYFDTITSNRFDVKLDTRKNRIGIADYSFLENVGLYLIDEFGYLYLLKDNIYLYCAKTDASATNLYGNVVQAPTRYADRLINLKNIVSENRLGYAYNKTENITSSQLDDAGYNTFVYNFIDKENENDKGTLYCITENGKITTCDIESGEWNSDNQGHCYASFTDNKEITAIYENASDDELFIALSNYAILKVTKSELVSKLGHNLSVSNLIYNTGSGSRINAMVYIPAYKTLYIADRSGYVSALDLNNNTYHTADITSRDYSELDKTKYAITKGDNAIGNVSINCITTDGNNLIVMGDFGRVASCSLSTFKWTPYNIANEVISQHDSNIFFNGKYTENDIVKTNGNIISFINYNNGKLIVFTNIGEIYSCNLATGVWTDCVGKIVLHNGSGFGPGIYDNGTASGNKSLNSVLRIGTVAYVTGESGRLFSIDLVEGGITGYRGSNTGVLVGPGYFYTGEDISETTYIKAITTDNRGKIFLAGTNNIAFTFSIENNELLIPTNSKLYYIARRQTRFDYLSSLLVRVSKGELSEKIPLYPPSEDDDIMGAYFQSSAFMFKNGNYVWKLNSSLDIIYFSDDNGVSYNAITDINNKEILPTTNEIGSVEYVESMPKGVVDANGKLFAVMNVGKDLLYSYLIYSDENQNVSWRRIKYYNQKSLDTIKLIGNDKLAILNENNKFDEIAFDVDGNIDISEKYDLVSYNESDDVLAYIDNSQLYYNDTLILDNTTSNIDKYIRSNINIRQDYESYSILGMYSNKNDVLLLVRIIHTDSLDELYVLDLCIIDDVLHNIYNYKIDLSSYLKDIQEINWNDLCFENTSDGINSVLLLNYTVNNSFLKTKGRSAMIFIHHDRYGDYLIPSAKIVNVFDSFGRIILFDNSDINAYVALYNTRQSVIQHTNSIHSYKFYKSSSITTPIRAISNAWRSIQVELGNGSDTSLPNAVAIRLKMNNTSISEADVLSKQYTLRYRVLISDITNGKFILYETEKSVGMSKTDDETRTIEPFLRVIAIDGFEDEIFELYTSKLDSNHKVNVTDDKYEISNGSLYSRDFMTFIQRFTGSAVAKYQIKIECLNTLPSEIDAKFYIEPYYQDSTSKAVFRNSIKTSEYNTDMAYTSANTIFGKNIDGFIVATLKDKLSDVKYPVISNKEHYVQKINNVEKIGIYADTYMCILRCNKTGTFDKINCVIMSNDDEYAIVPLSKNKKDLRFVFDNLGSKVLNDKSFAKLEFVRNGRSVHKMHNRSVFAKNVINNPDYYVDYEGRSRIVAIEGTLVNEFGLFESISSTDGNQKRIKQISEIRDGLKYNNTVSAYDNIKKRNVGYGYDIIDRYSVFESPYDMIKAWWIPAKGYITKGNERLSNFTFDDGVSNVIGRKYSPADKIINNNSPSEKAYTGGKNPINNGITSTVNGSQIISDSVEAYTELIDEKFPLENWKGWEWAKMCFIRKWRKVYTDKHIEFTYEVESPSTVEVLSSGTVRLIDHVTCVFDSVPYTAADFAKEEVRELLSAIKPSIDRQLYYYSDKYYDSSENERRDTFEGIGIETFKRATAWYYKNHQWKVVLDEILVLNNDTVFGESLDKNTIIENTNRARIPQDEFERRISNESALLREWYVSSSTDSVNADNLELMHHDSRYELDNGNAKPHMLDDPEDNVSVTFNNQVFPLASADDGNIIGEHVTYVSVPTAFDVVDIEASENSFGWANNQLLPKSNEIIRYKLGISKVAEDNVSKATYINKKDLLYENGNVVENDILFAYINDIDNVPNTALGKLGFDSVNGSSVDLTLQDNTYSIENINRKMSPLVNKYDFNYGIGAILPSLESTQYKYTTSVVSHDIVVKIRSYNSVAKSDNAHTNWFVNYEDIEYKIKLAVDENNKPVVTNIANPSNKISIEQISGDNTDATLLRYCGKSTQKYLYNKRFMFKVNNLIKNEGFNNISKEFIIWSVRDPIITNELTTNINALMDVGETFDITRDKCNIYADRFSFITLNKNQSYPKTLPEDGSGVVDRVFVKQFFKNEMNTETDITWTDYIGLYNKTIASFPQRINNTYPQEYHYLEFFNNKITPELKNVDINSFDCWLYLEQGSLNNKTMFVTQDDITGLSYNVAGTFCYQWIDGTIKRIRFTLDDNITLGDLYDKGFIDSYSEKTEIVQRRENENYFDKIVTIDVTGVNLTNNLNYINNTDTVTLFASEILEYAETADTVGDNTDVASTSTWLPGSSKDDENDNGIGMDEEYDGSGIETNETYVVRYDMMHIHPEGLTETGEDNATRYMNYNKKLISDIENGYELPSTINVSVGTTGTINGFTYDRTIVEYDETIYSADTPLRTFIDSVNIEKENADFIGFSVDGGNTTLTEEEIDEYIIPTSTYFKLYRVYISKNEAMLTIPGEYITDNIVISANGILINNEPVDSGENNPEDENEIVEEPEPDVNNEVVENGEENVEPVQSDQTDPDTTSTEPELEP